MKYTLLTALLLMASACPFAHAMPLPKMRTDARSILIDDGCGAFAHAGIDGHCHHVVQGWHRTLNGDNRPGALTYGPVYNGTGTPLYRNACPPLYHLGAQSGLCRPNSAF